MDWNPVWWLGLLEAKVTLVLGCAGLLGLALRNGSARLRHAIWSLALAAGLGLPLLPLLLPSWSPPGLSNWLAEAGPSDPFSGSMSSTDSASRSATSSNAETLESGLLENEGLPAPLHASAGLATQSLHTSQANQESATSIGIPWPRVLLVTWLLGVAVFAGSLLASLLRVRRLAAQAQRLDSPSWQSVLHQTTRMVGLQRPVRLLQSEGIEIPMTSGWQRPLVLLPREASAWTQERRQLVLLHELTHVRRGDWLLQVVGLTARALHWFNPLMTVALHRQALTRELACDDQVVALGAKPSVYAKHLLEIAVSISQRSSAPASALAMARRSQLEGRFMSILASSHPHRSGSVAFLTTLLGLGAVVLTVGAAEPLTQNPDPIQPEATAQESTQPPDQATHAGPELSAAEPRPSEYSKDHISQYGHWKHNRKSGVQMLSSHGMSLAFPAGDEIWVTFDAIGQSFDTFPLDFERLPAGVSVLMTTEYQGTTHSLTAIALEEGQSQYVWKVNGQKREFDQAAQQWKQAVLEQVRISAEVSRIRGEEGTLRGEIGTIRGEEGTLRGEIGTIRGEEGTLRGEIGTIRGEEGTLRGEISTLRGQESSLRGRISGLRGMESGLRGQISGLRARSGDHSAEIRRIEQQIRELDVEGQTNQIELQIQQLDLDKRTQDLQRQIEELRVDERSAKIQEKIIKLDTQGRISAVEKKISALDTKGRIAEVEKKIEQLDADRKVAELAKESEIKEQDLQRVLDSFLRKDRASE